MLDIKYILEVLTIAFPPPGKARHNFTINENGDLELCIFFDNFFYPFVLEEDSDFEDHPDDLIDQITRYMDISI